MEGPPAVPVLAPGLGGRLDGDSLVAWDYELHAAAYDPARDQWKRLPDLPLSFAECYPRGALLAEGRVFAWHCGTGALLDPAAETWSFVSGPVREPAGTPIAAREVVLFAGALTDGSANALWAYKPR
jgi:hypothetical protein